MNSFTKQIELAGYRTGRSRAFCDFLTLAVCALSAQEKEDEYLKVAKNYNATEMNAFSYAFAEMTNEMDANGVGLVDCLGDYFMEILSNERKGQFFTPPSVCDLMVSISNMASSCSDNSVSDCCCGSGRMFLSVAKINRNLTFYGADIDYQCCQMTLINMCLNGLYGTVSHQDSLTLEEWHRWRVARHPILFVPYIYEYDLTEETETAAVLIAEEVKVPTQIELFFDKIDCLL